MMPSFPGGRLLPLLNAASDPSRFLKFALVFSFQAGSWATRILTISGYFLNRTASAPEGGEMCAEALFVPSSPRASSYSEKTHHVIDLPHVDALQWQSVPSLLWDPVALPNETKGKKDGIMTLCVLRECIFWKTFFFFLSYTWHWKWWTVKLARPYIADVAGRWPVAWLSFHQHSLFTGKQVIPLFLPEALVYRHNMALCGEDVLVIGFVKWVVLIKQLQCKRDVSVYMTASNNGWVTQTKIYIFD